MEESNHPQATQHQKDYRPWGWFEVLSSKRGFQVKKIVVFLKRHFGLQSHEHRSEHWVVVKGQATVTIADTKKEVMEGESVLFKDVKASFRKWGSDDLIIIEVQIGNYLGEDDITRYEDVYKRQ